MAANTTKPTAIAALGGEGRFEIKVSDLPKLEHWLVVDKAGWPTVREFGVLLLDCNMNVLLITADDLCGQPMPYVRDITQHFELKYDEQ